MARYPKPVIRLAACTVYKYLLGRAREGKPGATKGMLVLKTRIPRDVLHYALKYLMRHGLVEARQTPYCSILGEEMVRYSVARIIIRGGGQN